MKRTYTCILCPKGCHLEAIVIEDNLHDLKGARCDRGRVYVEQELVNPHRQIASSVAIDGGQVPLASVRLSRPIPRDRIFDAMEEIKQIRLVAPVQSGDVIARDLLGLSVDVIVTRSVAREV